MSISAMQLVHALAGERGLLEATFRQLSNKAEARRKARSATVGTKFSHVEKTHDGQARLVFTTQSQSGQGTYRTVVDIVIPRYENGLFGWVNNVEHFTDADFAKLLDEADVRVGCKCKDFRFSGAAFNLRSSGDMADGEGIRGSDIPPDKRDPSRQAGLCKHLLAVHAAFPNEANDILADVRKEAGENIITAILDNPVVTKTEPSTEEHTPSETIAQATPPKPALKQGTVTALTAPESDGELGQAPPNFKESILGGVARAGKWLAGKIRDGFRNIASRIAPKLAEPAVDAGHAKDIVEQQAATPADVAVQDIIENE